MKPVNFNDTISLSKRYGDQRLNILELCLEP